MVNVNGSQKKKPEIIEKEEIKAHKRSVDSEFNDLFKDDGKEDSNENENSNSILNILLNSCQKENSGSENFNELFDEEQGDESGGPWEVKEMFYQEEKQGVYKNS